MGYHDHSFRVHLQSLKDFATELETQLDAIGRPSDGLAALVEHPVRLGAFAEADSLRDRHLAAVRQMHDLLGNVKEAIAFAGDVTDTVATGYEQADEDIAATLGLGERLMGTHLTAAAGDATAATSVPGSV